MSSLLATPAPDLRQTIFIKTAKGRAEMAARSAGLKSRQRSVLIMLDGRKSVRDIAGFPAEDVSDDIRHLLALELIAPMRAVDAEEATPGVPAPRQAAADDAVADTPALADIRALMTDSANTYLGLMAADVVARVRRARDRTELLAVVGHWHMAMRDSKYGRDAAGVYLERVRSRFGTALD